MTVAAICNTIDKLDEQWKTSVVSPVRKWLYDRPYVYTVIVVANQIFRALAMLALVNYLPFSMVVNCALSTAGSFVYYLTIEGHCPIKFALTACAGGMIMHVSLKQAAKLAQMSAMSTLSLYKTVSFGVVPLAAYIIFITYDSYKSVIDIYNKKKSSCCAP